MIPINKKNIDPQQSEILPIIAKNLKYFRLRKKLSQEKLGLITAVHRNSIRLLENGTTNVSVLILENICKGLDIKVAELFQEPPYEVNAE